MRIRSSKSRGRLGVARGLAQLGLRPHLALDVGAVWGSRAFSTAWAAFWCRRCLGLACGEPKVSSRKVTPTPSVPPTSCNVAGVHGFPLTISANSASRTEIDLAVLGQPGDRLIQEASLVPGEILRLLGQRPVGLPERR